MSPSVDPEHLLTLLAVAESGSESAAAELLGIGQSSVSRRLASLQQSAAEALTVRTVTGVRPTPAGERLLPHARAIRAALLASQREVAPEESRPLAFRIGFSPHVATGVGALFVAAAARGHAGERVAAELEESPSAALLARLRGSAPPDATGGRLDAALTFSSIIGQEPGFAAERLGADDLVLVSTTALTSGSELDLDALRKTPLLLPPAESPVHTRAVTALARAGFHPADAIVASSPAALKAAVLAGAGAGVALASACASEVAAGWLRAHVLDDAVELWLLVADRLPPREAAAVREFASHAASGLARPERGLGRGE